MPQNDLPEVIVGRGKSGNASEPTFRYACSKDGEHHSGHTDRNGRPGFSYNGAEAHAKWCDGVLKRFEYVKPVEA